jgi:glycosyltransferase involved in cell wall biosynthesis
MKKITILDWYCHQGNQYEFFKTGHNFYLVGLDGKVPKWNRDTRPLNKNVKLIDEETAKKNKFDIVIIRSGVKSQTYNYFIKAGAIPISFVQTTNIYPIPKDSENVIWNSYEVMKKYSGELKGKRHHYIVHGFDPAEFCYNNSVKNGRILTITNHFKSRDSYTGYNLWNTIRESVKFCDVFGSGNEDISKDIRSLPTFASLVDIYNLYSLYFNPTNNSAMPRSRGEAAMCGMPIVSTDNFDIGRYFKNRKNAILSNEKSEIINGIRLLQKNESARCDFGQAAREVAIKNFHIKDYIEKINQVFYSGAC